MFNYFKYSDDEYKEARDRKVNLNHISIDADYSKAADMRKYGFTMSDSYAFNLGKKDFKEYISTWEATQTIVGTDRDFLVVSADKLLFGMVYGNLVNVPTVWGIITNGAVSSVNGSGITNNNIYEHFIEHDGGVIKWRAGCDGFGVSVFKCDGKELYSKGKKVTKDQLKKIVDDAVYCIVQERVVQGDFENSIFDKSINTIRIISARKKNSTEHEILGALQRVGTNQSHPVDNFNQGGGSALIDLKSGVIGKMTCCNSFDESGDRMFYSCHPDTGAKIEGLQIPNWDKIKEKIIYLSREIPFFEFTAWDVALTNKGMTLIEINTSSSLNVFQVHGGVRNSFIGEKYREHGWLVDEDIFNGEE